MLCFRETNYQTSPPISRNILSINNLYIILRVGNSKIVIFRAVSKIFSCWENTASRIAGESKLGSTFGSTFPRKVARGNPPPPHPQPVTTSLIFNNTWKVHWGFLRESSCREPRAN